MQKLFENWRGYLKEERGPCDGLLQLTYDKIIFVVDRFAIKNEDEFRLKAYSLSEYITNPAHGEDIEKRPTIEIVTFKKSMNGWVFYDRIGAVDHIGKYLCAKNVRQGKFSFRPNTGMVKIITEDVLESFGEPPWNNPCLNEYQKKETEIVVERGGAIGALDDPKVREMIVGYFDSNHSRVLDCQQPER